MRVSVIIPAYHAEAFLSETIKSVLDQSYPVDEIIVVDDGSTDRTTEIALSFGSPVIAFRQNNAGASVARNHALEHATGDLIAFLDADDLWFPQKLERQVAYLSTHPEVGTVASSFLVFGAVPHLRVVELSDAKLLHFKALDFLVSPRVHPSTLLCRGELAHSIRFPDGVPDVEDVIYAALLRSQAPIGAVEEVLMRRREHPGQVTKTPEHFGRGVEARITWARANYELLGIDSAEDATAAILDAAAEDVMAQYWMRDISMFKKMRRQLMKVWPQGKPIPENLRRALPPSFVLLLKDLWDTSWKTDRSNLE